MSKVSFLFGINCHKPLGEAEAEISSAYHNSYLPFFLAMEKHPRVKFSFHISGIIYDWILKRHPEFFDLLKKLIRRGQAEVFGGGYYQPVLSVIPDSDKVGQIKMMNNFIEHHLGITPRGLWMPGDVWEPHLAKALAKSGIEYISLDSDYFVSAGISEADLSGFYVTEEEGMLLNIFPISNSIGRLMFSNRSEEALAYFESKTSLAGHCAVSSWNEAEKFADTFEDFLKNLEEHASWIRTETFSEYSDLNHPAGRIYLPAKNHRSRLLDPSANNLHKKMLHVGARLQSVKNSGSPNLEEARLELYRGQSSSAFHSAVYEHLIKAENLINKISRGIGHYTEIVITDFDKDGHEEVLMSNDQLNVYFSSFQGASIFELDFKPRAANLQDTAGRNSLKDHFFGPEMSLFELRSGSYKEYGNFFCSSYDFSPHRKKEEISVIFSRSGRVASVPVKVVKKVSLLRGQSIIHIEYEITNLGNEKLAAWFGSEFNLSLDPSVNSTGTLYKAGQVKLVDAQRGFSVSLLFEKEGILSRFPSQSQGLALIPIWQIELLPEKSWSNKITLKFES